MEREREELLARLAASEAPLSEVHRLRQDSAERALEVQALQKVESNRRMYVPRLSSLLPRSSSCCLSCCLSRAPPLSPQAVSDAHTHLFEERGRLLQLAAENDQLRLQLADRGRHEGRRQPRRAPPRSRGGSPAPSESEEGSGGSGASSERRHPQFHDHHHHHQQEQEQLSPHCSGSIDALTAAYESLQLHCEALEAQLAEQVRGRGRGWANICRERTCGALAEQGTASSSSSALGQKLGQPETAACPPPAARPAGERLCRAGGLPGGGPLHPGGGGHRPHGARAGRRRRVAEAPGGGGGGAAGHRPRLHPG